MEVRVRRVDGDGCYGDGLVVGVRVNKKHASQREEEEGEKKETKNREDRTEDELT